MNINSTSLMNMQSMLGMQQGTQQQQVLTDSQKETVNSILSNYDADSVTQEDFDAISQQLGQAGIMPSDSLQTAVEEVGYDFSEFIAAREEQGQRPPPPPQNGQNTASTEYTDELAELLASYEEDSEEASSFQTLLTSMRTNNESLVGNLIDARS